jgi:hypothetical protein
MDTRMLAGIRANSRLAPAPRAGESIQWRTHSCLLSRLQPPGHICSRPGAPELPPRGVHLGARGATISPIPQPENEKAEV